MDFYLTEIFFSFQGEGKYVGEYQLFFRASSCNLNCIYCDTPESKSLVDRFSLYLSAVSKKEFSNPLNIIKWEREIFPLLKEESRYVSTLSYTGGEPLLQEEFVFFLKKHFPEKKILLETNGTLPEKLEKVIDVIDIVSCDIKVDVFSSTNIEFINIAKAKDLYFKCVLSKSFSVDKYKEVFFQLESFRDVPLYLQPDSREVFNYEEIKRYYKIAKESFSSVYFVPQIHKIFKWQ